jgi:hypothetical protein
MRNAPPIGLAPLQNRVTAWLAETQATVVHIPLHEATGDDIAIRSNIPDAPTSLTMGTPPASPWDTRGQLTLDGSQVINTDNAVLRAALALQPFIGGWLIMSAWVNVGGTNNANRTCLALGATTGPGVRGGTLIGANTANRPRVGVVSQGTGTAAQQIITVGSTDLTTGWRHIAGGLKVQANGALADLAVYLDGILVGSSTDFAFAPAIPSNMTYGLSIGHRSSTDGTASEAMDGTQLTAISDIVIIAGAHLTDAQATQIVSALSLSRRELPRKLLGV